MIEEINNLFLFFNLSMIKLRYCLVCYMLGYKICLSRIFIGFKILYKFIEVKILEGFMLLVLDLFYIYLKLICVFMNNNKSYMVI